MTPSSVLSIVIASILGIYVVPHLALFSRRAALALKLAVAVLAFGVVFDFFAPLGIRELSRLRPPFDPMLIMPVSGPVLATLFWGCLAWAVVAVLQSGPAKGAP